MTNRIGRGVLLVSFICGAAAAEEAAAKAPLFLTATNGPNNFLAVINTRTKEVDYVPTGGAGGASGNAGGVAVSGKMAAVVNFGSSTVSIFTRTGATMKMVQTVKTVSPPLSVAFGHNHLVVLEQTMAESFALLGDALGANADGAVPLLRGDKSAAQIVAFDGGVMFSEKSGAIGLMDLATNGIGSGLTGPARQVVLPDAPNNDTPFGMIARGANVYVTIAHSDIEALVTGSKIVAMAAGPTPYKDATGSFLHAPCWNTLHGQFLYSSDSPGKQILRYLVSDSNVFFDKAGVATLGGSPTDLAADGGLLGVIDGGSGGMSNASVFEIDGEGELTLRFSVKIAAPINGAAIVR